MKYYEVYISKDHRFILRTDKSLETLELWARTMVNKYFPDFEITDVDFNEHSFFFFNAHNELIHIMFTERECYDV